MTKQEITSEALVRAKTSQSLANYQAIYAGFVEKGIPADEIKPRENVFTFNAWRALGMSVKRGEHGVKIVSWVPVKGCKKVGEDGQPVKTKCRPVTTTVFHESQVQPLNATKDEQATVKPRTAESQEPDGWKPPTIWDVDEPVPGVQYRLTH